MYIIPGSDWRIRNHDWNTLPPLDPMLLNTELPTERLSAGQIVGNTIKMCRSGQKMEM